jgi:hypothetical protein
MREMIQTVENPDRMLNREIADWVKRGHLFVSGINVTEGIAKARNPLLVVLSNADGIVPEATALSAHEKMGSSIKEILRVGNEAVPVAHADLFVSDIAQQWVFEPLAKWLIARNEAPHPKRTTSPPKSKVATKAGRRRSSQSSPKASAGRGDTGLSRKKS